MKILRFAAAVAGLFLCAGGAIAADVKVTDIKGYLFLERSGRLSANIFAAPGPFKNLSTAGGADGEPASNMLLEFVFTGDKNSAPKYASALINIIQSGKNGQKARTTKAFGGFVFGDGGEAHKSLFIENATCMPLEIEVKAGKSVKTVKVEFACDEPVEAKGPGVAPAPDAKPPKKK
jgi:hypothetical protein